jgi:hypothetical protein
MVGGGVGAMVGEGVGVVVGASTEGVLVEAIAGEGVGVVVGASTEGALVVAGSATQRTWPMVILQLVLRVGFQEYNCASVMPNFVQIK